MTRRLVGATASFLVLLAGLWLILSPFALGSQPDNADWTDQTTTDVWSGIGLAVVGVIGLVAFATALVQNLRERGLLQPRTPRAQITAAAEPSPPAGTASSSELDELLSPLVTALRGLADDRADGTTATNTHPRETRR